MKTRTAGVLVELVPIGQPGRVGYLVSNVGPEMLERSEVIRTLRWAADQLEDYPDIQRIASELGPEGESES